MSTEFQNVIRTTDSPGLANNDQKSNSLTIEDNPINDDVNVTDEHDMSNEVIEIKSEALDEESPSANINSLAVQKLAQLIASRQQTNGQVNQVDTRVSMDQTTPVTNNSFDIFNSSSLVKSPDNNRSLTSPIESRNGRKASNPFTKNQTNFLREFYTNTTVYPTQQQRQNLAESLNLSTKQVSVWFKNRRQREKERTGISVHEQQQSFSRLPVRSIGEMLRNQQEFQQPQEMEPNQTLVQYINGLNKVETPVSVQIPNVIPTSVSTQFVENIQNIQASLGLKEVKVTCKKCTAVFTLNCTVNSKSNLYYCQSCIGQADLENPDDELISNAEYNQLPENEEIAQLKEEIKLRDSILQNHAEYSQGLERLCERQRNTITKMKIENLSLKGVLAKQITVLASMKTQRQNLEDVIENCSRLLKKQN